MKANVVPKNSSMLPPSLEQRGQWSTSSQHFQVRDCSSSTQLEETIREPTFELPLNKPDSQQPSVIQSTALSDGSEIPKEPEARSSDPVASLRGLQKVRAEMMEKLEEREVGSSHSKPKSKTNIEKFRDPTYFRAGSGSNNGKTAVLQWMDGINNYPSERVENVSPLVFESEVSYDYNSALCNQSF